MKLRPVVLAVAACLPYLAAASAAEAPSKASGRVTLFDGHSLAGWHPEGDAQWRIVEGALVSDQSGDGWLRSDKTYSDFILTLEFRNSPKGNSGVFLRASAESKPGEPNPKDAYELQIYNEDPKWPTGTIEDVIARKVDVNPAAGRWHRYEVEVRGGKIEASLDGQNVLAGHDDKLKSGHIGLQHHRGMKIEFRRIAVVPLTP